MWKNMAANLKLYAEKVFDIEFDICPLSPNEFLTTRLLVGREGLFPYLNHKSVEDYKLLLKIMMLIVINFKWL